MAITTVEPTEPQWHYLGDDGAPHGPYPASTMRYWLTQGYFNAATQVRCSWPLRPDMVSRIGLAQALPSFGGTVGEGWIMPAYSNPAHSQASRYLPTSTLFANPNLAFTPDGGAWMVAYERACGVACLVEGGIGAGLGTREAVSAGVDTMVKGGAPLDPSLLLDVLGVK